MWFVANFKVPGGSRAAPGPEISARCPNLHGAELRAETRINIPTSNETY